MAQEGMTSSLCESIIQILYTNACKICYTYMYASLRSEVALVEQKLCFMIHHEAVDLLGSTVADDIKDASLKDDEISLQ